MIRAIRYHRASGHCVASIGLASPQLAAKYADDAHGIVMAPDGVDHLSVWVMPDGALALREPVSIAVPAVAAPGEAVQVTGLPPDAWIEIDGVIEQIEGTTFQRQEPSTRALDLVLAGRFSGSVRLEWEDGAARVARLRQQEYLAALPVPQQLEAIVEALRGRPEKLAMVSARIDAIKAAMPKIDGED